MSINCTYLINDTCIVRFAELIGRYCGLITIEFKFESMHHQIHFDYAVKRVVLVALKVMRE